MRGAGRSRRKKCRLEAALEIAGLKPGTYEGAMGRKSEEDNLRDGDDRWRPVRGNSAGRLGAKAAAFAGEGCGGSGE